jgi:hypothetical protein
VGAGVCPVAGAQLAARFVQRFYDWYVQHGSTMHGAIARRSSDLNPTLRTALCADRDEQPKDSGVRRMRGEENATPDLIAERRMRGRALCPRVQEGALTIARGFLVVATVVGLLGCQQHLSLWLEPGSTAQQVKVRISRWRDASQRVPDLKEVTVVRCTNEGSVSHEALWRMSRVGAPRGPAPLVVTLGQPAPDGWTSTGSLGALSAGCYAVLADGDPGESGALTLHIGADGAVTSG